MPNDVYVGVDLVREEVVLISIDPGHGRGAYELRGRFAGDGEGLIVLDRDESYDGRRATEVALASQGVGLGWTFVVRDEVSAANRNLSEEWSR